MCCHVRLYELDDVHLNELDTLARWLKRWSIVLAVELVQG